MFVHLFGLDIGFKCIAECSQKAPFFSFFFFPNSGRKMIILNLICIFL